MNNSKKGSFFEERGIETNLLGNVKTKLGEAMKSSMQNGDDAARPLPHHPKNWLVAFNGNSLYSRMNYYDTNVEIPVVYVAGPISAAWEVLNNQEVTDSVSYAAMLIGVTNAINSLGLPLISLEDFRGKRGTFLYNNLEKRFDLNSKDVELLGLVENRRESLYYPMAALFAPTNGLFDYIEKSVPVLKKE